MLGAAAFLALSPLAAPANQPSEQVTQPSAEVADGIIDALDRESRWFVRTGVAGAFYNSGATISAGGVTVPDATVRVTDNVTAMLDVGYNLSDSFAVQVMVGVPPRSSAIGKGAVAPFGKLGALRLAPVIATAMYRFPEFRGFRPYVGAGGAYVFILKDYDGAVTDLSARGNWGATLQGGVEYRLNRRLELFADYKRLWLKVKAQGMLGPAPVRARVTLDPDLVSAGLKLNFR